MYSANKLSPLGEKVELAWVKAGPLPPIAKVSAAGAGIGTGDGDTHMSGGAEMNGEKHGDGGREKEMDYDVAEEDFDVAE